MGPKRRRLEGDEDILGPVRRAETGEATLAQRLTEYVERIDTDMVRLRALPESHTCLSWHQPLACSASCAWRRMHCRSLHASCTHLCTASGGQGILMHCTYEVC